LAGIQSKTFHQDFRTIRIDARFEKERPKLEQGEDFPRASLRMENDRDKIAAKGENWAGFQRIPLALKNIGPTPSRMISHIGEFWR